MSNTLRLASFKDIPVESASPEKRILEENKENYSIVIKGEKAYKSFVVWF